MVTFSFLSSKYGNLKKTNPKKLFVGFAMVLFFSPMCEILPKNKHSLELLFKGLF